MKKLKTLLILTLCFTFIITTSNLNMNSDINPLGHHPHNVGKK